MQYYCIYDGARFSAGFTRSFHAVSGKFFGVFSPLIAKSHFRAGFSLHGHQLQKRLRPYCVCKISYKLAGQARANRIETYMNTGYSTQVTRKRHSSTSEYRLGLFTVDCRTVSMRASLHWQVQQ
jgi:hypothetical protein